MTLNDLLKIVDDNTRIQMHTMLLGLNFSANGYRSSFLNNEEATELLTKEIGIVWPAEIEGISTLMVKLK